MFLNKFIFTLISRFLFSYVIKSISTSNDFIFLYFFNFLVSNIWDLHSSSWEIVNPYSKSTSSTIPFWGSSIISSKEQIAFYLLWEFLRIWLSWFFSSSFFSNYFIFISSCRIVSSSFLKTYCWPWLSRCAISLSCEVKFYCNLSLALLSFEFSILSKLI